MLDSGLSTISDEEIFALSTESRLKRYLEVEQPNLDIKQLVKLTGDASTRQYFRVFCSDESSLIASVYQEKFDSNNHPFCDLTELFETANLPVPQIVGVSGHFAIMLMQDLGDIRLQDWLINVDEEKQKAAYKEAISLILSIQAATDLSYKRKSISSQLAFDEVKLMWELDFFYLHYFQNYLQVTLPVEEETNLKQELQTIARELANRPRFLCHRDFHSRNLMLYQDRQYIIDHQDARMGPETYDLASLLRDPYVDLREEIIKELYDFFITQKLTSGANQNWVEEIKQEFELMTVQRIVKAIGTYAYQTAVVKNTVYEPYIPKAITTVVDAAKRLERFPSLCNVLTGYKK